MSWFAELAGKAETLLNNLDEQTGAALRNHNVVKQKKHDISEYVLTEPAWGSKKRHISRTLKKTTPAIEARSNYNAIRKLSPMSQQSKDNHEQPKDFSPKTRRSPTRRSSPQYNLNHCPKTLVGDIKDNEIVMDQFGLRRRRYSLPSDLELLNNETWTYKMQNLEVENAMLKNELNVMNREVSELLDRLRNTEDELTKIHAKLEDSELVIHREKLDKESLTSQLEQMKLKVQELTTVEMIKYKERNQDLETEVSLLQDANRDLQEKVKELTEKTNEKNSAQMKLENELRHAQSVISELQNNLENSTAECHRLEQDWEAYKLRVKSMLVAKDNEIKALQEGMNLNEDNKILLEQLESLKEEREELFQSVCRVRSECEAMKQRMEQVEVRCGGAERVAAALRDALRDERAARNRADAQAIAIGKELKTLQIETGQTIASLRTALRDKDNELNHLKETTSSVRTTDTSALNVADYDVMQGSIDNQKIQYLTEMLMERQGKIDKLLADNNILRIQLEKLESKHKSEISSRANNMYAHSVLHVPEGEGRGRVRSKHATGSPLAALSLRIGLFVRRHPFFRILIIIYMIGLHMWVLTVLFTSTPDTVTKPTKL